MQLTQLAQGIIIPANSQIVDVILNVTTVANDSGTATVQVGHAGDTDDIYQH